MSSECKDILKQALKHPLISIGMPVYNGEPFLRTAIDALLAQTFENFELIISDNASTDKTQSLCEEYTHRDDRVRYVRQRSNKGAAWNFHFVLEQSVGEYFMWAAADDWRPKTFIRDALSVYLQDSSLVCVQGQIKFISSGLLIFNKNSSKSFPPQAYASFFLARELYGKCMLMYGLFKRTSLLKADWDQLTNETNWWWNDALFLFSLLKQGGFVFCQFPGMRYLLKTTQADYKRASVVSVKRSKMVACFAFHPLTHYKAYLQLTPTNKKVLILILIPLKSLKSTLEAWFFYFVKRIVPLCYRYGCVKSAANTDKARQEVSS